MKKLISVFDQYTCQFYKVTGLYCPGCGGTRSFYSLWMGHPLLSFLYHPIILYGVLGIAATVFCLLWYAFTGRPLVTLRDTSATSDDSAGCKKIMTVATCIRYYLLGAAIIVLLNYNVRILLTVLFNMDPMP